MSTESGTWSSVKLLEDVRHVLEAESERLASFRHANAEHTPRFASLRWKLIALVLATMALPMIASALFVYHSYSDSAERAAEQSATQLVGAIATSFDRFLDDVERYTFLPVTDARILGVFREHADSDRAVMSKAERESINAALVPVRVETNDVSNLRLYTMDGHYIDLIGENSWRTRSWTIDTEGSWMDLAMEADGAVVLLGEEIDAGVHAESGAVSVARLVREPLTHRPLGYAVVDLRHEFIDELVGPVPSRATAQSTVQLVNGDGTPFYTTASGKQLEPGSRIDVTTLAGSGRFGVVASLLSETFQTQAASLTRWWLLFGGMALVVASTAAVLFARRLTRPIESLRDTMRRVAAGEITRRAPVTTRDEVGTLAVALNAMLDEIDALVSRLENMAVREREAATWALLGQMNPHFLFNSLEMVNMIAARKQEWEISDAISRVGQQFRYMIDVSSSEVPLAEEIAFVRNWVDIYSASPATALELVVEAQSADLDRLVPKFLLQPIVENAMIHAPSGIRKVAVRVAHRDQVVTVAVSNATSVSAKKSQRTVERINALIAGTPPAVQGAQRGAGGNGLINVHRRLQLTYGERFGLHAYLEGQVFTVEATIPSGAAA